MKKLFKTLLVSFALGLAVLGVPVATAMVQDNVIVAEAASHKNPTVWAENNCINFDIHYGHKIKTVKVDGKTIKSSKIYNCGTVMTPGNGCTKNCGVTNYFVKAKEGTHKVEIQDNKGYWVISYVTVY